MNLREVRSEVFLRQDLESILRAINAANAGLAELLPEQQAACYRAGFSDALQAVATAIHASLTPDEAFVEPRVFDSRPAHFGVRALSQEGESSSLELRPRA